MADKNTIPPEVEEVAASDAPEVELAQDEAEKSAKEIKSEKKADKKAEKAAKKDKAEIEKLMAQRDEYLSALQRERADFENYKKRNNTAVAQSFTRGAESVLEKMLPVVDNLDRAVAAVDGDDPVKKGVELVLRQLTDVLASFGVEEIKAEGRQFDPNLHNAVMQVEAEEGQEAGVVCEVLQKGYKTGEKVLRHSMVKVRQ